MQSKQFEARRRLLRVAAAGAASALLAACAGRAAEQDSTPTIRPVPANDTAVPTGEATLSAEEALLATLGAAPTPPPSPSPVSLSAPRLIAAVNTDRAMYAPGTPVRIDITLDNQTGTAYAGRVRIVSFHLGQQLDQQEHPVDNLADGATATVGFTWEPPADDFRGYRVEVLAENPDGALVEDAVTAIDISSDWRRFPRYGAVSRFDSTVQPADVVARLNRYHLNGLQFYDWQWQHHRPYSAEESWPDVAGRTIWRSIVEGLIDEAHRRGIQAMNYSLAFGAYDHYWEDGSGVQVAWGMFKDGRGDYDPSRQDFHPLPASWATSRIYLMNLGSAAWQQYIFGQQKQVFEHFGFDGWHIDTLGKRGNLWDWDAQPIDLAATYAPFTNNARDALQKRVLFNAVGGYGHDEIAAGTDVDFLYTELWEQDGIRTYNDIAGLVARTRALSDKALVVPAYMNRTAAQTAAGGTGRLNEPSVRMANAVIAALGAMHFEIVDGDGMLSNEYFPNQALDMGESLRRATVDLYDFLVAYQNLLRDQVTDLRVPITITGVETSTDGRQGTVWTFARKRAATTILHLINLRELPSTLWRDDLAIYPPPAPLTDLRITVTLPESLPERATLWYATPDRAHGKAQPLQFETNSDSQGTQVSFSLAYLEYWTMVWIVAL